MCMGVMGVGICRLLRREHVGNGQSMLRRTLHLFFAIDGPEIKGHVPIPAYNIRIPPLGGISESPNRGVADYGEHIRVDLMVDGHP